MLIFVIRDSLHNIRSRQDTRPEMFRMLWCLKSGQLGIEMFKTS